MYLWKKFPLQSQTQLLVTKASAAVTIMFLIGSCKAVCPEAGHIVNQEAAANHGVSTAADLPPALGQNHMVQTKKDPLKKRENIVVLAKIGTSMQIMVVATDIQLPPQRIYLIVHTVLSMDTMIPWYRETHLIVCQIYRQWQ